MTVEINTLIARYIAENTRLIVPGIGTLLRRKESGEIVFMEMLKKGDGVLNSLVGAHFNLPEAAATAAVENYVAEVKKSFEADKKFIMDGVGVLLVGANGSVGFIFNPSAHTIDAVKPTEPQVAQADTTEAIEEVPSVVIPEEDRKEATVDEEPIVAAAPVEDEVEMKEGGKGFGLSGVTDKFRAITKPSKPTEKRAKQNKKIKLDGITILAIVSGLIAIGTLIWGMIPSRTPLDIDAPIEVVEE